MERLLEDKAETDIAIYWDEPFDLYEVWHIANVIIEVPSHLNMDGELDISCQGSGAGGDGGSPLLFQLRRAISAHQTLPKNRRYRLKGTLRIRRCEGIKAA